MFTELSMMVTYETSYTVDTGVCIMGGTVGPPHHEATPLCSFVYLKYVVQHVVLVIGNNYVVLII